MKFSENWLREWVDPPVDGDELCRQLTMAGLEVDAVEPAGPALADVVVGAVESVAPHPDADKLSVCEVDCGERGRRTIVCGAPNARQGLRAPVALPGTRLPAGIEVTESDLRGVRSQGMLCSADELGLSDDGEGLLELDDAAPAGTALSAHLGLDDNVIEIDLTPNRGDCLSIRGVAREVGVWNRMDVTASDTGAVAPGDAPEVTVAIDDGDACPVYAGRVIRGLDAGARTPDWLRERLRRAGIRPIFPVVDVTNYVMLELGQPMHAFDLARLAGGIRVRRARTGEALTLLDGAGVELDAGTLVIADDDGPVAMAGVMGGARTGVAEDTVDIFLESACFAPLAVAGQGRRYKLHTDSLHRFERGVDPELQVRALERATHLIRGIAGGEAGPVTRAGDGFGERTEIRLRRDRVARLLGTVVADEDIVDILARLEMSVADETDGWRITPPSHRYDIWLEADLIEEIARIHGYDNLPARRGRVYTAIDEDREGERPLSGIREILRQRGYDEAVTYSFVDADLQSRLDPDAAAIDLDNPIAEPYAQMRTTLWSSLIPCWLHNLRRQQRRVRLYEYGLRFTRDESAELGVAQRETLTGLAHGPAAPEHWDAAGRELDFFDVKGDVESLLAVGEGEATFRAEAHPALHPGRSARILVDGTPAGWLGQLHPSLKKYFDIKALPYVFELDYEFVRRVAVPRMTLVPEFPEVRRDLALAVPEAVTAGELVRALRDADEPLLQNIDVFDVFYGGDLETGFKSIALGLIFQDKTSTLDSRGVDNALTRLIAQVETRCGATVRGR